MFPTRVIGTACAAVVAFGVLAGEDALARRPKGPECRVTRLDGKVARCTRKNLPPCLWKDWVRVRDAKPDPDSCPYPPCEVEGIDDFQEVDLDGVAATREFIVREPVVFTGGNAQKSPFYIVQLKRGRCTAVMVGNGALWLLTARDKGYLRLYHEAATGGPLCYHGTHAWNGKKYLVKEEHEDVPCDDLERIRKAEGPVLLESPGQ